MIEYIMPHSVTQASVHVLQWCCHVTFLRTGWYKWSVQ